MAITSATLENQAQISLHLEVMAMHLAEDEVQTGATMAAAALSRMTHIQGTDLVLLTGILLSVVMDSLFSS